MAKSKSGYYKANQGFATVFDGENVFVQKDELVPAGHPLLKGREDLFDEAASLSRFDDDDDAKPKSKAEPEVEQATAAPGEKRGKSGG